jgi:hypothetical protein
MRRKFSEIVAEAAEFGVKVVDNGGKEWPIEFEIGVPDDGMRYVHAHMYHKDGRTWCGYTNWPKQTGRKTGTKAIVADWCLDWCANGVF